MSRQAVFAHRGNVPDVGSEKLSVKRLSWMGPHKTESVIVTFEDGNRVAQAEEARKQREKIMGNIRVQLQRINELLESPQREQQQQQQQQIDENGSQQRAPASAMSAARSRQADPKQLVSYLDGSSHSRFSIANYNAYVRAKMIAVMEAHPPNSQWPLLPTDEDFPVPAISEGTGVSPSNVTSAPTWRDMLGGRGTIGYNTKASACSKELLQYEFFQGVDFGEGFNDKATAAGPLKEEQQQSQQPQQEGQPPATTETARAEEKQPEPTVPKVEEKQPVVVTAAAPAASTTSNETETSQAPVEPTVETTETARPDAVAVEPQQEEQPKQEEKQQQPQQEEAKPAEDVPAPAPAPVAVADDEI